MIQRPDRWRRDSGLTLGRPYREPWWGLGGARGGEGIEPAVDPPTMELDPSTPDQFVEPTTATRPTGGESLKAADPHALEPEIDSGTYRRESRRMDDDDGGAVETGPIPELELDEGSREPEESAVDDSEAVYVMAGPKPVIADHGPRSSSEVDEPDGGQPDRAERDTGRSAGGRRIAIGAAAAVAAVLAVVASLALFGGEDDSPEVAATDPSPAAPADQPAGSDAPTEASPEPTETELPAFELTQPPVLVICNDGTSFSGIEQPDGTFTDPETGEVLSCS